MIILLYVVDTVRLAWGLLCACVSVDYLFRATHYQVSVGLLVLKGLEDGGQDPRVVLCVQAKTE